MQRVNLKMKMWQTMLSMFLASMAALLISTAPAYADEGEETLEGYESQPIVMVAEDEGAQEASVQETAAEAVVQVAPAEAPVVEAAVAEDAAPAADVPAAGNPAASQEAAVEEAAPQQQAAADPIAEETLSRVNEDGTQVAIDAVGNVYSITESGDYVLAGKGDTSVSIIGAIKVALTLNNVDINVGKDLSAINISEGAEVSIVVVGECSLQGHNGIHVPGGTSVDISGASGKDGSDKLVATGMEQQGCGIGHFYKDGFSGSDAGSDLRSGNAGNITIHDIALVEAHGAGNNQGGVGIGGGRTDDATQGKVVIRNVGEVTATAVSKATAIGAGFWRNADVTIENCDSVVAFGGNTAAAIGTSRNASKATDASNPAAVSNVYIIDSNVYAEGGNSGAGIGSGHQDLSIGDYSRDATDRRTALLNISITGNSTVIAKGGTNAAGIGGGYKDYSPNILIGAGAHVTAYAGARETGGSKVPEAIGSGSDGSGIFSDDEGTIVIEDGATVRAFGYGYDAVVAGATDGKGALGSKWAIGRELDSTGSTSVAVLRFLDGDYYGEEIDGMDFFVANGGTIVLREVNTGAEYSVQVPAGYSSIAVTLPSGTYICFAEGADGVLYSFLDSEGYSAVSHGEKTGRTRQVYGDEGIDQATEGSYRDYTFEYRPYGTGSDVVTLHYAFGTYDAGFTVGDGMTFFDAVAIRPNAPVTVPEPVVDPEPEPAPVPDPDPEPAPEPAPAPDPEPAPAPVPATPVTPAVVTPVVDAPVPDAPAADAPAAPAAPAVVAIADDGVPLAGGIDPVAAAVQQATYDPEIESILDDENPLAGLMHGEDCWVHWWILLGIIVTALYSSTVLARRGRNSHNLKKMDDDTMNGTYDDSRVVVPPAPALNLGPQPAIAAEA